jgi:hypothetical protein
MSGWRKKNSGRSASAPRASRQFSYGARLVAEDGTHTWIDDCKPWPRPALGEQSGELAVVEVDPEDGSVIVDVCAVPANPRLFDGPANNQFEVNDLRRVAEELNERPPGWYVRVHGRSDGWLDVGLVHRFVVCETPGSSGGVSLTFVRVAEPVSDGRRFDPRSDTANSAEYTARLQVICDERNRAEAADRLARRGVANTASEDQAGRAREAADLAGILRSTLDDWRRGVE